MEQFSRGELVFDVRDEGPSDGPVVVLLHGFPQHNDSWEPVAARLVERGYRCLMPNQRGYSPGARPRRRRDYRLAELAADVGALIDASGADRVHLVGHDWGAAVGWAVAAGLPDRLASFSPVSVPHPFALMKSMVTSRQLAASWYMFAFQLPWLPERVLRSRRGSSTGMERQLVGSGQTPDAARRDALALTDAGALTAALNWYRALPLSVAGGDRAKVKVPTMYVWSDGDIALLEKAARASGDYVAGEYRFEVLPGVSHWIPDERPDELADLLLDWFAAHPAG